MGCILQHGVYKDWMGEGGKWRKEGTGGGEKCTGGGEGVK